MPKTAALNLRGVKPFLEKVRGRAGDVDRG